MLKGRSAKSLLLFSLGAFLAAMAQQPGRTFDEINGAARAAREKGDNAAYLKNVQELAEIAPRHPSIQYALARALALTGDSAGALAQLDRIGRLGLSFPVEQEPAFLSMKTDPRFLVAARRLADNGKGLGRGKGIIKLGLEGEAAEGVAWSESLKAFLMGSGGSIHAVRLDQQAPARPIARTFAPQALGIRPDPKSRSYLVCTNHQGGDSAVVRHHEANGAITGIYKLPMKDALCNDIALLKNGSFAVTDSMNHRVFHLVSGKLEPLATQKPTYIPNGIASDPGGDRLYVAHAGGILVHDMTSGRSWELEAINTLIGAIDGLVWHKGSLIGVQNQPGANRLLRITPDAPGQKADVEVLLAGADFPADVTTVAVAGNEAFVIGRNAPTDGQRGEQILIRAPL